MSMEAPKPQRDPEFYDEDGRVKDPEIAHTMARKTDDLLESKKNALQKTTWFKPIEKLNVVRHFQRREAALNKWMETGPQRIRESDEYIKKRKADEVLLEGPSLLSTEEEQALLERFDKLERIKVDKRVCQYLFDGKAHNDIRDRDCSIENFVSFFENFDKLLLSNPAHGTNGLINAGICTVRCANGKTSIDCWVGKGQDEFVVAEVMQG